MNWFLHFCTGYGFVIFVGEICSLAWRVIGPPCRRLAGYRSTQQGGER